jgi:O-antigen/teichoic acid export membrane protein
MSLRRNVAITYFGQVWAAAMGIVFLPLFARYLGIEQFGLIGVFGVLQGAFGLLDLGLTPTVTREMARLRGGAHTASSIRELLRSIELSCLVLAIVMTVAVWLGSPYIARDWLMSQGISAEVLEQSLRIMGFVLAARCLEQIYRGTLQGLQDFLWLNVVNGMVATLRWAGAYAVIVGVSPSVSAFFLWQAIVALLSLLVLVLRTYAILPPAMQRARFNPASLRNVAGFASGMFVSAVLTFLLTQGDKLVISRLLPLTALGYYTLASSISNGLIQLFVPMNTAVYPQLTAQVARGDTASLERTYLRACEWMANVIVPPALLLALFSREVLMLWTGDEQLAQAVAPLLSILALGTLCNGFVNLPYLLQLAHGWTSMSIKVNIVALAIALPTLALFAIPRYGALGAAVVWLVLNACYVVLSVQLMHRRILSTIKWRWYRVAVIRPLAVGAVSSALLWSVLPGVSTRWQSAIVVVCAVTLIALGVLAFSADARAVIAAQSSRR